MSAPAPGRPRSLGASLLDQVLADTLDPAYAQVAAARSARAAEEAAAPTAGTGPAARPSWLRRNRGDLLVAAALLLGGLLAAVTYQEAAVGAQGREAAREALREDIVQESAIGDELAAQLEALTAEVAQTRQQALDTSVVGQRALNQLAQAQHGAAAVAVTGPGLRVTLGNAPPAADSDPVGGSDQIALAGRVQDGDLQLAVNALWASGAEAVSINGQRVGPTTAIRQAGDAILVDFRPVMNPYEISAVGDPDDLARAFLNTPEANDLAELTKDFGVVFDFARADELDLPAGSNAELLFADPLAANDEQGEALPPATPEPPTDGG
ncbi:DUF881 domain-containing protein [Modestobacter sp. VKM Ac-2983]|uniref:DUF881 domain-containing protein n=1 Tax=Modestobacter sp. VKM Ac-2983 TaxID=3004137 RepID=UPI0022ABB584|nr:DUF881 domain-containing protein [Modestobacter sp. VKM Ac-2983]MCZ2805708.1 DUF881 domain-containing protein [Modestobacter sp. VKM Ac-2983]